MRSFFISVVHIQHLFVRHLELSDVNLVISDMNLELSDGNPVIIVVDLGPFDCQVVSFKPFNLFIHLAEP
jgi:hypothetical protein